MSTLRGVEDDSFVFFPWQEEQLGRLHGQVATHVQLLLECYGMTARDGRYQALANQAHDLIFGLQVFRDSQVAMRGPQVGTPTTSSEHGLPFSVCARECTPHQWQ
jgi:hypothetical protein